MSDTINFIAKDMLRRAIDLAVKMPRALGCDARDADGKFCPATSPTAEQFSILGLVFRAACNMGFHPDATPEENGDLFTACKLACHTLDKFSRIRYARTIQDLNDDRTIPQLQVIYVLMKAVEYVEEIPEIAVTENV